MGELEEAGWALRMPRYLRFGRGVVDDLTEHLDLVGSGEVCLTTDAGVVAAGVTEPVQELVREAGCTVDVFAGIESQPSVSTVQSMVDRVRARGSVAIVAVGGGSVVDASKITALLASNEGSVRDVIDWFGSGFAKERAMRAPLPLFTVPTMVSGADFVSAAVVTDPEAHTKFPCWSLGMMPRAIFLDPAHTASAPREVLLDAALDSFTHALEGLTSKKSNPITQQLALDAAGRIYRALPALERDPGDTVAREELCLGCMEAALVVGNTRAAAIHGLSYPVSSAFPISHGRCNILLAPTVVRFNGKAVGKQYTDLAAALGLDPTGEAAEAVASAISGLSQSLGLPATLAEIGVVPESIPDLVQAAERNRFFFDDVNPRPVTRADMEQLYTDALAPA